MSTTHKDRGAEPALKRIVNDPVSRRKFIGLTGGTIGAGALLAACGEDDETTTEAETTTTEEEMASQFGEGDLGIVNYALTLEYLEADFYDKVANSGLFDGDNLDLIKTFGANEEAHVEALLQTAKSLGDPAPKPETDFPLESADEVLQLAATVENLGAAAYLGQAAAIESEDILAAALSIHTIEGRHAAALNKMLGESITPDGAFAEPATMEEVLDAVQPFIVS
ncbi:MAG: ferritin-like domain-containing protein [Solirubrobacterales bacterium]